MRTRRTLSIGGVLLTAGLLVCCGSGTIHSDPGGDGAVDGAVDAAVGEDASAPQPDASTTPQPDASQQPDAGCVPASCQSLGYDCGQWDDGCASTLDCGTCGADETCDSGTCAATPVDCSGIANNSSFELCGSGVDYCSGVFTGGEGCVAFCAAAGLQCTARYGGEPGCQQEPQNVLSCTENNGHLSDWCDCGPVPVNPNCNSDPQNPPTYQEMHYSAATFFNRSAWVLQCYDYAYTAQYVEHEACDNLYQAGSGQGSATFTFTVGPGEYEVYVEGRHTANRNPAGMLTVVTSNGQVHTNHIMQADSSGTLQLDLHGTYCLENTVEVLIDSTVSGASDSVRRVVLVPVP